MKTCKLCKQMKSLDNFSPAATYKGKQYYRGECKSCNVITQRMPDRVESTKKRN